MPLAAIAIPSGYAVLGWHSIGTLLAHRCAVYLRPVEPVDTVDQRWSRPKQIEGKPVPGLVLVFTAGVPRLDAIPLDATPLLVRRGPVGPIVLDDACLSRRHAEIWFDRGFYVRDLGSRNGTALDGVAVTGERSAGSERVLRAGDSLFLLVDDLRPFADHERPAGDAVVGPTLRRVWDEIRRAARGDSGLHVTGETGAGKELAARAFHAASSHRDGPFVAVNCATIPQNLAERLLFGARKGAYSGADTDTEGYLQAAHEGTLFLDEVAELDLAVQAKLLRALETKEVLPLGAAKPKRVDLRVVSATHGELRKRVADGTFREDLYFRIGKPAVALPPVRERREDIPWLIAAALRATSRVPHVSLVEAAMLRTWPGNVRELLGEIAAAARASEDAQSDIVEAIHLDEDAGLAFDEQAASAAPARGPDRLAIERALRREHGNVSRAAEELGVHRTQLRRWIASLGIDPKAFS